VECHTTKLHIVQKKSLHTWQNRHDPSSTGSEHSAQYCTQTTYTRGLQNTDAATRQSHL